MPGADSVRRVTTLRRRLRQAGGRAADLGTAADPGGNLFEVRGAGTDVVNRAATAVTAVGNATRVDGAAAAQNLQGTVWVDYDNDGQIDPGEPGLGGVTVTLTGTFADPWVSHVHTLTINWGPAEVATTLALAADQRTFTVSHQYLDDDPTGSAVDTYTIAVDVAAEDDTAAATATALLQVADAAPTAGPVTGPAAAVRNRAVTFGGSFADVGTRDTHQVEWTFGDGTTIAFHPSTDPGALAPTHAYEAAAGVYTATLRIRDDDGGVGTRTATVTVTAAAVQGADLYVGGTAGGDQITVRDKVSGAFKVRINGVVIGTFTATGRIFVFAGDGDDDVTVEHDIDNPTFLYGQGGNDVIRGGGGNDVIRGGGGNDFVSGGAGDDSLKARDADDVLVAGDGDDLLTFPAQWDPKLGIHVT